MKVIVRSRLLINTTILSGVFLALALVCLMRPTCRCRIDNAYRKIAMRQETQERGVRFNEIMAGNGVTPDGQRFDGNVYLSSNCVLINVHIESATSREGSADKAQSELRSAYRVNEQKPELDANGKVIGGRAVALLGSRGERAEVIKWSEQGIMKVESSSLETVLEFERRETN